MVVPLDPADRTMHGRLLPTRNLAITRSIVITLVFVLSDSCLTMATLNLVLTMRLLLTEVYKLGSSVLHAHNPAAWHPRNGDVSTRKEK